MIWRPRKCQVMLLVLLVLLVCASATSGCCGGCCGCAVAVAPSDEGGPGRRSGKTPSSAEKRKGVTSVALSLRTGGCPGPRLSLWFEGEAHVHVGGSSEPFLAGGASDSFVRLCGALSGPLLLRAAVYHFCRWLKAPGACCIASAARAGTRSSARWSGVVRGGRRAVVKPTEPSETFQNREKSQMSQDGRVLLLAELRPNIGSWTGVEQ